jgi:hypothetical protein
VNKTSRLTQWPERDNFGLCDVHLWRRIIFSWPAASFFIAVASAAIVVAVFGAGIHGTVLVLQMTGRWSFLLFWFAYAGSATATLFPSAFDGLSRCGRELGLSFASAQLVHVAFVLWLYHVATEPVGVMAFFWVAVLCTSLLALFSNPQLRDALSPRLWRISRTVALEYIALVFASDFIFLPLRAGYDKYFPLYLPFALMLVTGASLRLAAFVRRTIWS